MRIIKTRVDEATHAELVRQRRQAKLPSISALFLKRCNVLSDDLQANEIVRRALRLAARKPSGSQFRLRDLFPAAQWQAMPKTVRLRAGKLFFEAASKGEEVVAADKTAANHQLYRRP